MKNVKLRIFKDAKLILIPKNYTLEEDGTHRLGLNQFHHDLGEAVDAITGMPMSNRNPKIPVGPVEVEATITFMEDVRIIFEEGGYKVDVFGARSNFMDALIQQPTVIYRSH